MRRQDPRARRRPRACKACRVIKAPGEFDMGPSGKRRKGVCRDCEGQRAAIGEQRQAVKRATWRDPQTGHWMRRCCDCREAKPLAYNFYWFDAAHTKRQYTCKACAAKRSTERRRVPLADPVLAPVVRAQRARWAREWRQRNPEKYRAQLRRQRERKKRDAKRMERERQAGRIRYRLRAEREGRAPRPLKASGIRGSHAGPVRGTVDDESGGHLPSKPLAEVIARRVAATDLRVEDVCDDLGVNVRTFSAWRSGEREFVQFDVADRIVCRLGLNWFDVYDDEVFPEAHARAAELFG